MKTIKARYAGHCHRCEKHFAAGTSIAFNGTTYCLPCVEAMRVQDAERDAEDSARQAKAHADFLAGKFIRTDLSADGKWIIVRGAPSYEFAKAEAFALVASVKAAGGQAKITRHKGRDGKSYTGRKRVFWSQWSSIPEHDGWEFRCVVETADKAA
jgi:hypothetical protein